MSMHFYWFENRYGTNTGRGASIKKAMPQLWLHEHKGLSNKVTPPKKKERERQEKKKNAGPEHYTYTITYNDSLRGKEPRKEFKNTNQIEIMTMQK